MCLWLEGATLYCCFVDFKKAFDIVPRVGLWQRLQELGAPNDLCMGIYRVYQRMMCRIKGHHGLSQAFESIMGVKQGCPLFPTLFGLCIDKLEEVLLIAMSNETTKSPSIGMYVIIALTQPRSIHNSEPISSRFELNWMPSSTINPIALMRTRTSERRL